jgi:signal transduction histidine kinase
MAQDHIEVTEPSQAPTSDLAAIIAVQHEVATAGLDLDRVMNLICGRTQTLTRATGATVELVEGDELVYCAATGSAAPHVGLRLKVGASLVGLCHRTGQLTRCDDSESDDRVDREACRKVGLRSMIVVPLRRAGVGVGVLKVLSTQPAAFGEAEAQTLQLMAGLLGACMGNAAELEARKQAQHEVAALNAELERRVDERTSQLERALHIREQFLSAASHELKTPLTSLVLQARRIRSLCDELDPSIFAAAKLAELLPTVERQAYRISALVENLLDAAELSARPEQHLEPLTLMSFVEEVAGSLEADRQPSGSTLTVSGDATVVALGQRVALERAVRGLLSNAYKFGAGGVVRVEVASSAGRALVRVGDAGRGIAPERLAGLFQKFERGQAEPREWGLGLGLWMARRLVETMGGTLELESTGGQGSTFTISLPRA